MKTGLKLSCLLLVFLLLATLIAVSGLVPGSREPPGTQEKIPVYRYEVVHAYPHDRFAFTEGLSYSNGTLFEGTGLMGNSSLREVDLATGRVKRIRNISDDYFGEGVTVFGNRIAQLTEDSHIAIVYDMDTLLPVTTFTYPDEGWGITWDGRYLIMSDGTSSLSFIDPTTFQPVRRINVTAGGAPVESLNELEFVKGEIYANIWPTDRIARIDPATGTVTGWIDLHGLLPPQERSLIGWSAIDRMRGRTAIPFEEEACLEGIAYDPAGDRLFVTGKLWPELFEIRLVPE